MFNRKFLISAAFLIFSLCLSAQAEEREGLPRLLVFQSPSCSRCVSSKKDLLPEIEKEYKGRLIVEYYDLTDIKSHNFLLGLKERYAPDIGELALPLFFMQGKFLSGNSDLKNTLPVFIEGNLADASKDGIAVSAVDIIEYFKGIRPLVVVGAGLIDGINPCAFTVIVFFISYLSLQGYRKRDIIAIGLSFIAAVFITYALIGVGAFNFLYRLRLFWVFARAFNIGVGLLSIILGFLALHDFIKFIKTKETGGLILQLPESVKKRIHSLIGLHYRRNHREKEGGRRVFLPRLVLSAFITGFLISLLEAVCTGQLYLPTIAFVLKTAPIKLQAFSYLIVYNIMFILPLLAIFTMAILGVASGRFALYLNKRLAAIKLIMVFVFFGLGLLLFWRG